MRLPWTRLRPRCSSRAIGSKRRTAMPLSVRRLERRRVLDASLAGIMVNIPIDEGDTVFASPIDPDGQGTLFYNWEAKQGGDVIATGFDSTFNFVAPDNGQIDINLMLEDSTQISASANTSLVAGSVAPTAALTNDGPVAEGSPADVMFDMQFDPSSADTMAGFRYAYDFDNDGTFDVGDGTYGGSVGDAIQTVPGSFLDDGPGTYTVRARIIDKDDDYTDYTTDVDVFNIAPVLDDVMGDAINENEFATVTATIVDPSTSDVFEVDVDWMDGTSDTIIGLGNMNASGTVGGTGYVWTAATRELALSHQYLDDDLSITSSDDYQVELTVRDGDLGATGPYTAVVTVHNVPPVLKVADDRMINEGQELDLSGMGGAPILGVFIDNGTLDTHTATVNWGDGTATESAMIFSVGMSGALGGTHTYADDGVYTVTVIVTDDDNGSDTKTFDVTVKNVRPVLAVADDRVIDEGELLDLSGLGGAPILGVYADDGTLDTHTATVNWGDGSLTKAATVFPTGSSGALGGTHTYADDGMYTVTVTVTDDDGDSDTQTFTVTVDNVNPTLSVTPSPTTINEGQSVSFDAMFSDPGFDNPLNTLDPSNGGELEESFRYYLDWGDGRDQVPDMMVADTNGMPGTDSTGMFDGMHTYADDGTYTVTVRLADDDMSGNFASGVAGVDFVEQTFTVMVNNVDPVLIDIENLEVNEGTAFTLRDLGVRLSDPGFDNLLNTLDPSNGGETQETFTGFTIDWGDGVGVSESVSIDNVNDRVSGSPGVPTTAFFTHDAYTYADDGTYTATISFQDDDGSVVMRQLQITVNNVNPTLAVAANQIVNESDDLVLPVIATFEDPGFDNPNNPNGPVSPLINDSLTESFAYFIDWGDGRDQIGTMSVADLNGMVGTPSSGSFGAMHNYADDGIYTVTVRIADDNMTAFNVAQMFVDGENEVDFVEQTFTVTVNNLDPSFVPTGGMNLQGDDINTDGITTIRMSFTDPGYDNPANPVDPPTGDRFLESFTYTVDWSDGTVDTISVVLVSPGSPLVFNDQTTVVSSMRVSGNATVLTSGMIEVQHRYLGPPNPLNPTADVTINLTLSDDNGGTIFASVDVGNPGIQTQMVAIDTTPDVPRLELDDPPTTEAFVAQQAASTQVVQTQDVRRGGGELAAATERFLQLHQVFPDGKLGPGYRIRDEALLNLREFFRTLPDGGYEIYLVRNLVRAANKPGRFVIGVDVRRGQVIDVSDDSAGGRDRPPTAEQPIEVEKSLDENPLLERMPDGSTQIDPAAPVDGAATDSTTQSTEIGKQEDEQTDRLSLRPYLPAGVSLGLVAAATGGPWSRQVDGALAEADDRSWQRLRRAGRLGRVSRPVPA